MSERNVELHCRWTAAFNSRNIDAIIAFCDPRIELHSTFGVGGAVYQGHDGIRRWHRDLEEAWGDEIRIEPEAYFDLGECSLTFHVLRGRGLRSGAEPVRLGASVTRWREDLAVYTKVYADREGALRDLGVSEDELEAIAP